MIRNVCVAIADRRATKWSCPLIVVAHRLFTLFSSVLFYQRRNAAAPNRRDQLLQLAALAITTQRRAAAPSCLVADVLHALMELAECGREHRSSRDVSASRATRGASIARRFNTLALDKSSFIVSSNDVVIAHQRITTASRGVDRRVRSIRDDDLCEQNIAS